MYYIFLKTPFEKNTIVIRHLFSLSEAEKYILAHNKEHVNSLLKSCTKEHSPTDEKYKYFYPLKETPLVVSSGDLEGFPNFYQITFIKPFVSKGWIYNSSIDIQTDFQYTICKYDNVVKRPDPRISTKKDPSEKTLHEALLENEFFQKMYLP